MTREDFDELPGSDVDALRPFATRSTYGPGTTLFRKGDLPEEIMILESGEIELVVDPGHERLVVQILHAGTLVDHLAIILDVPYRYSAVTLTRATVLRLRLDTIEALEELFPEIGFRWLSLLAHTLDRAYERVRELTGKSSHEQVTYLLLHESAERNEPTVDLTQDEVAATLALSRQTVSRVLHDLAHEHAIKQERGRIRILDEEKLQAHLPR